MWFAEIDKANRPMVVLFVVSLLPSIDFFLCMMIEVMAGTFRDIPGRSKVLIALSTSPCRPPWSVGKVQDIIRTSASC
jgi:hypothetical protein